MQRVDLEPGRDGPGRRTERLGHHHAAEGAMTNPPVGTLGGERRAPIGTGLRLGRGDRIDQVGHRGRHQLGLLGLVNLHAYLQPLHQGTTLPDL